MRLPFRTPPALDPATGRPFGDLGTADDALAFVLDNAGDDIEALSFLRYWDAGDVRAWPTFYPWLAARENARPSLTPAERYRTLNRTFLASAAATVATLYWAKVGGPVWPFLITTAFCVVAYVASELARRKAEQPPRVARTETVAR